MARQSKRKKIIQDAIARFDSLQCSSSSVELHYFIDKELKSKGLDVMSEHEKKRIPNRVFREPEFRWRFSNPWV